MSWTGPRLADLDSAGRLLAQVPAERWPFGPPDAHQGGCMLRAGGLFCDCEASDSGPAHRHAQTTWAPPATPCPAHFGEVEPCPVCRSYIAAGL